MMKCPICNNELIHDFCNECNMNIEILNKVFITSRRLYNKALVKANERDISTAMQLLHRSLEFDKKFINARNLLGLLYYRIGELGEAIVQWQLSYQFFADENENKAYQYMKKLYASGSKRKLEQTKSTTNMYNDALTHIQQKSEDLAIIKLRKAVHINPSFLKANNLLTYCYLKTKQESKALYCINNVLAIDNRNPFAVYYREIIQPSEDSEEEEILSYEETKRTGNQFATSSVLNRSKEKGIASLSQIVIFICGILIGVLAVIFLFTPEQLSKLETEFSSSVEVYENQLKDKDDVISNLRDQVVALDGTVTEMQKELKSNDLSEEKIEEANLLMNAAILFMNEQIIESADLLQTIDSSMLTDNGKLLFNNLKEKTFTEAGEIAFNEGDDLYRNKTYEESIIAFEKALHYSSTSWYAEEAYYRIARAYKELGQVQKSIEAFDIYFSKYNATTGAFYQYAVNHYAALK